MYIGGLPIPLQVQQVSFVPPLTDRDIYDLLAYTPSDNGSNAYFYGSVASINNGNLGNYYYDNYGGGTGAGESSGLTVQAGVFVLFLTFAAPVIINRLTFNFGQFNGFGNIPDSFSVYRGATTATLLYTTTAILRTTTAAVADQTYNVNDLAGFDTASATYRIDFTAPVWTSILELRIYGTVA